MLPKARLESTDLAVYPQVSGETILFDIQNYRAINLNPAACLIWRRCDGETSILELAQALRDDLGLEADEATVWAALDALDRNHLLQHCPPPPPGLSAALRRRLRRRLIVAAGTALVSSIVAPMAAWAATCVPNAGGCLSKNGTCVVSNQCCSCDCNTSSHNCK